MTTESEDLRTLYGNRFEDQERQRTDLWQVLCSEFFQRWVPRDATVLDVAAGHCEFINNIDAGHKLAVDLNPDVALRAGAGVDTYVTRSDDMADIGTGSVDRVFISNFFEHVPREVIASTLVEVRRVLKPSGKLLILQPNVRYCARDYWMFFDHITPVDDRALVEVLRATGYDTEVCLPRFLPYTTKGRLPAGPGLVKMYLKIPLAWKVLGAQAFIVASPAG
ncbi:class I SAM-dependent methyltransferase [Nocardioides sp. CER19]|uniref:class I SAM-dependent methyltransferase n=1 Tax=Nocardioides sp. CER19 TaxID=3038538 RepID=UPI00244D6EC4|nr:class I SAM-dependent methyltransferase [Nocardioides sp. CER19]MDH2414069.1 class I SAM-dependent methyltransferase [Nocardioides sp. CER19]